MEFTLAQKQNFGLNALIWVKLHWLFIMMVCQLLNGHLKLRSTAQNANHPMWIGVMKYFKLKWITGAEWYYFVMIANLNAYSLVQ